MLSQGLVFTFLFFNLVAGATPSRRWYNTHDYYVLEHALSAPASVADCASALGLELIEQVGELKDHWLLRVPKSLSKREADPIAEKLRLLRRMAAESPSITARSDSHHALARRVSSSVLSLERQTLRRRIKRAPPPVSLQKSQSKVIAHRFGIQDPIFSDQWHLVNEEHPEHMVNVTPLWDQGITGKGVISAVIDDGLDYESDDLADNFYAEGSYNFNDHEDLPTPKLWDDTHGTRCAGEIAAVKNDVCGIGIAYESKVAGLRILSGPISNVDEVAALNYRFQDTSIYSCSWGPPDDGRAMDAPSALIQKAILNGVQNGRGGKGSLFVFASGNGGGSGDQCNFDGYTNSIYSVTVAAIDYKGLHPLYSEACAANMVVAYSSGSGKFISTTNVGRNKYSSSHSGTSAAAPIAVGVFALALQVRPELTWRDVQHLCVATAVHINPDDPDWEQTAAGRPFSYKYGYGKLDASLFVEAAKTWTLVKPQAWFDIPMIKLEDANTSAMTGGRPILAGGVRSSTSVTQDMVKNHNFEKLEHITIKVWITHSRRGAVSVELTSPHGIQSVLAAPRPHDMHTHGFPGWQFMTLKHWDEDPVGEWTLRVADTAEANMTGSFLAWSMTFWGSTVDASKAKLWKFPSPDDPPESDAVEKPQESQTPSTTTAAATKQHPKPTEGLPADHGTMPGEASKPAFGNFPSGETGDAVDVDSSKDVMQSGTWIYAVLVVVAICGIASAVYFWRKKAHGSSYSSIAADEGAPMVQLDGGSSHALLDEDELDEEESGGQGYSQPNRSGPGAYRDIPTEE